MTADWKQSPLKLMAVQMILTYALLGTACALFETQLTFNIDAGDENCFYAPANTSDHLVIQYNVVQQGHETESQISFYLTTASGKIVVSDIESRENSHTFIAESAGAFKACFGNFITYSRKQVYFAVSIGGDQNITDWSDQNIVFEATDPEDYDVKLFEIEHAIDQLRYRVRQSRRQQQQLRLLEARDRSLAETNFELVNTWSMVQMMVMVGVLAVQVVVVRNLFCDSVQPLGRLWRWK